MKKLLLLFLVVLVVPTVALADTTSVTPTSALIWGEQVVIDNQIVPNYNALITGSHRNSRPALGAYFQVGDGFNEAFVGPTFHRWDTDLFLGLLGAEQTDSFRYRWTTSAYYSSGKKTALFVYERSSPEDWWLRAYADYQVRPGGHVGWMIQRSLGGGPRLQVDIPATSWSVWGAALFDGDRVNQIYALQAAF